MVPTCCGPVAERRRRGRELSHILVQVQAGPPTTLRIEPGGPIFARPKTSVRTVRCRLLLPLPKDTNSATLRLQINWPRIFGSTWVMNPS